METPHVPLLGEGSDKPLLSRNQKLLLFFVVLTVALAGVAVGIYFGVRSSSPTGLSTSRAGTAYVAPTRDTWGKHMGVVCHGTFTLCITNTSVRHWLKEEQHFFLLFFCSSLFFHPSLSGCQLCQSCTCLGSDMDKS